MLDVAGLELARDDVARLRHRATAGVILFARNFASRAQVTKLVSQIRRARADLLVAVDHEGGRVQRFRSDGFTALPAMKLLGEMWDGDPQMGAIRATCAARSVGLVVARELAACGIDLSFSPVLDLFSATSAVIGDRAFHHDARVVTFLARSLIEGLHLGGMAACGKHFPGHGSVAGDSHQMLPLDPRPLASILKRDAAPYEWLGPVLDAVMPAHVVYSQVDDVPAGFSRRWIQTVLRKRFGFQGAVISDDLSMAGAAVAGDIVARGSKAVRAGCDMILVCNAPDEADHLLGGIAGTSDRLSRSRLRKLRASRRPDWIGLSKDQAYQIARSESLKILNTVG